MHVAEMDEAVTKVSQEEGFEVYPEMDRARKHCHKKN